MGRIRHDAIVVTDETDYCDDLKVAHAKARKIFAGTAVHVTDLTPCGVNASQSFLIAPDGSKKGWPDSDQGDDLRRSFVDWLRSEESRVDWIEVNFGGDDSDHIRVRGEYDDDWRTAPEEAANG